MSHGARVIRTGVSSAGPAAPTTAASSTASAGSDGELVDGAYFRSCAGMLKVAQMISLLVGFISVNNSQWTNYSAYSYFQIVTMCDLVMVLFFYIIHIFRVYRMLTCVSWPLAEFLHYLIGTILLLIASIVAASKSYNVTGLVAGATFGFLATILCVLSIWSSYKVSCITQSTSFICNSAIHTEDQEAQKKSTATCEFKEVKSTTIDTIVHNFLKNNSQKREKLQTNNILVLDQVTNILANSCLQY
uniref:CKLF like MARVEL transmembrane domain containing 7 n=1 Tax=Anser brachyrhynchus TaxID=132585 RepID=A0A8B9BHK7_9AVES